MFSNHVQNKLNTLSALTDITVSLDRWTDTSGNLIFEFMALKRYQEIELNILDLSVYHYNKGFIKSKVKEVLTTNSIQTLFVIAYIIP
ncbi:hypothetical protein F8M41_022850 [Gigaspora margarita]|uniref:DUF659 domain-containing protein n=1 Tax=Gigaspora margarita TaxID=4874 RepID=A0A8H4EHM8_GIGMA|nr:hypothetical protein F8M41_022850 [Gigaspora margarita]